MEGLRDPSPFFFEKNEGELFGLKVFIQNQEFSALNVYCHPGVQIKFYRGCKRKGKAQVFVRKVKSGLLRRLKVRCDERKGPWRILSGVTVLGSGYWINKGVQRQFEEYLL